MTTRHLLSLFDLTEPEHNYLLQRALTLKAMHQRGEPYFPLRGKMLGMVFEKSSTRTRVSFEAAMAQLGGNSLFLSPRDSQLGRGEPVEDTARVLSRMLDTVVLRTFAHSTVEQFAAHSQVPVINALTDRYHPCQLLGDMLTFYEQRGNFRGKQVAWVGDGNNMCQTYIQASVCYGFNLRISTPARYAPDPAILALAQGHVQLYPEPCDAVAGADLVVTDVWVSMGDEAHAEQRQQALRPYQVNAALMRHARPDALFMHCLPAPRGEEVTGDVIDGNQSAVWDEAENRLHAQKALLEWLLLGTV